MRPSSSRCWGRLRFWGCWFISRAVLFVARPEIARQIPKFTELPLIFSGHNGGGGGNHDPLPASHGNLPRASLDPQLVPPTVILPKEPPKLAVDPTVMVAPDVPLQGGQVGDPLSQFSKVLSNGPGGPGGMGTGCCDGIGPSTGPGAGAGPPGIFPAGRQGVTRTASRLQSRTELLRRGPKGESAGHCVAVASGR